MNAGTGHRLDLAPMPATRRPGPVVETARVEAHEDLGGGNWRLLLSNRYIADEALPGQFVMVTVPDVGGSHFLLPRPIAIHRRHPGAGTFELIYKIAGAGTGALTAVEPGAELEIVGPLGQPFRIEADHRSILLIGRGIGICAFMTVAEEAQTRGCAVSAVLSARSPETVIGLEDARELGAEAIPVDDVSGTSDAAAVEARLLERYDAQPPDVIMACGSSRLERLAVRIGKRWGVPVQLSLEAHMACGMGYCHGCALPGPADPAREGPLVCVDGPVFQAAEEA